MKNYKINVKPFINKNLLPKPAEDILLDTQYPLYYQVTFQRKNTQIKSFFDLYASTLEYPDAYVQQAIDLEIFVLSTTVREEYKLQGKDFTLSGIKDRYQFYLAPIDTLLKQYLSKKLIKAISYCQGPYKTILRYDGPDVEFLTLYTAASTLMKDLQRHIAPDFKLEIEAYSHLVHSLPDGLDEFSQATVAHWVSGLVPLEDLHHENVGNKHLDYASIIDKIVNYKLKFT